MLRNVHPLLNADLLYALASMGHGDVLAVVDRTYPASAHGRRVVRLDGVGTTEAAAALLSVYPVDTFVEPAAFRMCVVGAPDAVPPVQLEFLEALRVAEGRQVDVGSLERFEFYRRCRDAFVVVATGEARPYGCFLLTKGVVNSDG